MEMATRDYQPMALSIKYCHSRRSDHSSGFDPATKIGGRMVIPLGPPEKQVMTLVIKTGENEFVKENHGTFVFVPMLKGIVK
jgi:hypothetical protein